MQNDGDIAAVGEINGHIVNVIYRNHKGSEFYTWKASDDKKTWKTDHLTYGTVDRAIEAAIEYFFPGVEHVFVEPNYAKDLEALNALLYVGGLTEDIETVQDAIELKDMFIQAKDAVVQVKAKVAKDLEQARLIVASTHGPWHDASTNLSAIAGVFAAQCDVLQQITDRSIETIDAFLDHLQQ